MEYTRVLLLLGLVVITIASPGELSVADDVFKESSGVLLLERIVGGRFRRQAQEEEPWCFCGSDSWLLKFTTSNLDKTTSCLINKTDSTDSTTDKKKSQCAYECFFRKNNLLNSEDKFDNTAIKDIFKSKAFVEEGLKQTADTVIDRCLSTGTVHTEALNTVLDEAKGTTCIQEPYKFVLCLLFEMAQNCPENMKKSEVIECKRLYDDLSESDTTVGAKSNEIQ